MLQERSQRWHCVIKVDFIYMFIRIFLVDMYDLNITFTVIKERKSGINFLQDELFLAAVEIYQTQSIL